MIPETEFRILPVSSQEPTDRTAEGTAAGDGQSLDLGTVDTTDEAQDTPVRVFWWRVKDMKDAVEIIRSEKTDIIVTDLKLGGDIGVTQEPGSASRQQHTDKSVSRI